MSPHTCRNAVPSRPRQRGLTLIELLVSMAIAVFLLGGLLTIVGNTRRAFGAQNLMAQLQDNERLTMTLIGDVIQEAGYFPDPTQNTATGVLPVVAGTFPTAGQSITGTYAAAAPGDTLTVRFATTKSDGIINCIGGTNQTVTSPPPLLYVNVFSIDASGNLICTLTAINGAASVTTQATLVSGAQNLPAIQRMTILYGVTTNTALNNGAVDTYLRADQMTATNWVNVVSVKMTLLFVNPLFGQPNQRPTISFERVVDVMNRAGVKT